MDILDLFLRADALYQDIRVTCGSRWMVFDETAKEFIVYEKILYKRNTHVICQTSDVEDAVSYLLGEWT